MSWTEQQIQTLKQMWGNGFSANDIARKLSEHSKSVVVSRNAVIGKAHRMKLSVGGDIKRDVALPSNVGNVMAGITKIAKKRTMLRPLPTIPSIQKAAAPMSSVAKPVVAREAPRAIDIAKRTEGIAVTKAGERHCRWPVGDPRSPDFRFCGCASYESLPYCVDHARVAYQTVSRRSRSSESDSSLEFRLPSVGRY